MNIYCGNLAYGVTEDDLRTAFAEYGEVTSVNVITDKFSGQSKGFGFVEMAENSEADAAIKALNDTALGGRNIRVNQAKPREDRPQRSSGGGGGRW
jgi:RNA recognition motif-containing protein